MKKKAAMILSFTVGSMLFASTAMAEIASKNGYEQLKDGLKFTAESFTDRLSSYTLDMSFVMKDNGAVVSSESSLNKVDVSKQASENISTSSRGTTKSGNYFYRDKNVSISKSGDQDVYYVNEFTTPIENETFQNPFKESKAGDIERIADALIGNLKDYVVVTQNSDGSKELSGSLTEAQIPALVNAVTSFAFKNEFGSYNSARVGVTPDSAPILTQDIFVKEVKGKMVVDKDGLIQSVLGTGVLSGKDPQGTEHNLTFELLAKVVDVNVTEVIKPDLTGKKVEKQVQNNYDKISNPQMYVGKYKNDIILEKDGKLQKIGERILEITQMDDKNVSASYKEEYRAGFEAYNSGLKEFKLTGTFQNPFSADFNYTDASGKVMKSNIYINAHQAKVFLGIPVTSKGSVMFGSEFNRAFD